MTLAIPTMHPVKSAPETPRYLGSVKPKPYLIMVTNKAAGTTTAVTRTPSGFYNYWAYSDGVYCQWQSDDSTDYGLMRAYCPWSMWCGTVAAKTLYSDNARDETIKAAADKVPSSF